MWLIRLELSSALGSCPFFLTKWKLEAGLRSGEIWSYMGFWLIKLFTKEVSPVFAFGQREGGYSSWAGHAMATAIVVGTLIIIVQRRSQTKNQSAWRPRFALLFIFMIMASRVYLGVHYPTDVIGVSLDGLLSIISNFPLWQAAFSVAFQGKAETEMRKAGFAGLCLDKESLFFMIEQTRLEASNPI